MSNYSIKPFFIIFLFSLLACGSGPDAPGSDRLSEVKTRRLGDAQALLQQYGLSWDDFELYIRAFKKEKKLEVWAKEKGNHQFKQIDIYLFCKSSGTLGPKRREGDGQIPEGFYHIDRFNPKSQYHLSLGINYPNAADRKHADHSAPGSDIFIHGGCETVGCIPIMDSKIEILYLLAEQAHMLGQRNIPVHIFPTIMRPGPLKVLELNHPEHMALWSQMQPVYKEFNRYKRIPAISIDKHGAYQVKRLR